MRGASSLAHGALQGSTAKLAAPVPVTVGVLLNVNAVVPEFSTVTASVLFVVTVPNAFHEKAGQCQEQFSLRSCFAGAGRLSRHPSIRRMRVSSA